jgi:hypothetical protein
MCPLGLEHDHLQKADGAIVRLYQHIPVAAHLFLDFSPARCPALLFYREVLVVINFRQTFEQVVHCISSA